MRDAAVVVVAQDPEDGPHLLEHLGAGLLDGSKGLTCLFRSLVENVCGDAGLDVDDGDRVRDGVVDLACDPEPFLVDAGAGFFLASSFGQLGALQRFGRDESP